MGRGKLFWIIIEAETIFQWLYMKKRNNMLSFFYLLLWVEVWQVICQVGPWPLLAKGNKL
jgi:hypothetical protein